MPSALRTKLADGPISQGTVGYYPETWMRWIGDLSPVSLDQRTGKQDINRAQLCEFVAENLNESPIDALVRTLQWGYGNSARGASRGRAILVGGSKDKDHTKRFDDEVLARLNRSIALIRTGNVGDAYNSLAFGDSRLAGLGPAFFTKWMYVVSADGDGRNPAVMPILDALVRSWIRKHADVSLAYKSTPDYVTYVDLLDSWSDPARDIYRVDVETAIFQLERQSREMPKAGK